MSLSNTATRIIVSIVSIPLIIGAALIGNYFFLFLVLGIGLISYFELYSMVKQKDTSVNLVVGLLSVASIILNIYFDWIAFEILSMLIVIGILLNELFRNKNEAIANIGTSLLGIFYIGLFSGAILEIREIYNFSDMLYSRGGYLIIATLFTIWICDSAAFFLGTAFGKHKLHERVSPKKSWEGAIAGFIFSIFTMIAAQFSLLNFLSIFDALILGIIIGTIGQMGDLVESLIKRDAGVKDSSALIPGHGGMFDRFDSLFLSSPVIFIYLHFSL